MVVGLFYYGKELYFNGEAEVEKCVIVLVGLWIK